MNSEKIVALIANGNMSKADDTVKDLLYIKASEILSDYKQELAQSFFNQEQE